MTPLTSPKGKLYLVPAPLDFGCATQSPITDVLPELTLRTAAGLQHWVCENAKSARAYLKRISEHFPLAVPMQQQNLQELPREAHKKGDHGGKGGAVFDAKALLAPALAGHDMGLVSEAGMPAVADPGSSIVRAAHDAGITVIPLVGPVSLLMTLAASGLNGQNFAFVGYLPQDAGQRVQRIKELEQLALRHNQAQLFIETPYRNQALWQALLATVQASTRVAMASGLTLETANIQSRSAKEWKKLGSEPDNRTPVVFAIGQ